MAAPTDPLLALRAAISGGQLDGSTKLVIRSADTEQPQETDDIAAATDFVITGPSPHSFPLSTATRFVTNGTAVDLRSILFAYQSKDVAIPEYISESQEKGLNNLKFVERLDLIAWLEGSADSEYIGPLEGDAAAAAVSSAQIAAGAVGGTAALPGAAAGKGDRLGGVYRHERRLGDRNSVLRGIKPTDFSHVKKTAESFLRQGKTGKSGNGTTQPNANGSSLPTHPKKHGRRPDPIIIVSPAPSSLLRMSNIKTFLDAGMYTPADSNSGVGELNHITRIVPAIDANRPMRFILVESTERFKPDDWKHVVAVFTIGQQWQFAHYRWPTPGDLFAHVMGIHVGWRGEPPPSSVRSWGKGVKHLEIDKWTGTEQGRWRDREVVQKLWAEVEEHMRRRGWGRDTGPK